MILFAGLACHRDRALFHMFLASGARAAELLGITVHDARPGDGRIYVATKGLGADQAGVPGVAGGVLLAGARPLGELAWQGHRPGPGQSLLVDPPGSLLRLELPIPLCGRR